MLTLEEIKNLINEQKEYLIREYQISNIEIFGSYVRKEQNESSDLDILVEYNVLPDLLKFINLENYLEDILKIKVDLVHKPSIRKELKEIILNEAVQL